MEHTLAAYEHELNRLESLIAEMGQHGISLLENAMLALQARHAEIAQHVIEDDAREDRLEVEVDELVIRVIALRQPAAGDLRHVTTAFKAAVHFERIGDYAANLAKRSLILPPDLPLRQLLGLPEMGRWTANMLSDTVRAYETRDLELAVSTWQKDERLDTLTAELFVDVATSMKDGSQTVDVGTHLMFIAKNLERVGDHATNICELIHYRVSGRRLSSARPKYNLLTV
jgi:phosphate transport system protein